MLLIGNYIAKRNFFVSITKYCFVFRFIILLKQNASTVIWRYVKKCFNLIFKVVVPLE